MESDSLEPLLPAAADIEQGLVETAAESHLQHVFWWDPGLWEGARREQFPHASDVQTVGLGPALPNPQGGGFGTLG
jgi:hypothetical protein